jgi:hypothetical protein
LLPAEAWGKKRWLWAFPVRAKAMRSLAPRRNFLIASLDPPMSIYFAARVNRFLKNSSEVETSQSSKVEKSANRFKGFKKGTKNSANLPRGLNRFLTTTRLDGSSKSGDPSNPLKKSLNGASKVKVEALNIQFRAEHGNKTRMFTVRVQCDPCIFALKILGVEENPPARYTLRAKSSFACGLKLPEKCANARMLS